MLAVAIVCPFVQYSNSCAGVYLELHAALPADGFKGKFLLSFGIHRGELEEVTCSKVAWFQSQITQRERRPTCTLEKGSLQCVAKSVLDVTRNTWNSHGLQPVEKGASLT